MRMRPSMRTGGLLVLLFNLLATVLVVRGNTEIVNFEATHEAGVEIPEALHWPTLSQANPERLWHIQPALLNTPLKAVCEPKGKLPCLHELWLKLDLDSNAWSTFSKFTLRLSWPASHPADFAIELFTPQELKQQLQPSVPSQQTSQSTRLKYARVRVVDTGVRVPSMAAAPVAAVPFILRLEPLYLGVLPASVAPVLAALLPIVIFAAMFLVPKVQRYLSAVAEDVRHELALTPQVKIKQS